MNFTHHELVQLAAERTIAPIRVLDLRARQPGLVVANKDLVAGLERVFALGVLTVDADHFILQHVGVAIRPQLGELVRPLDKPRGHFQAAQFLDHRIRPGFHPGGEHPDQENEAGNNGQTTQQARTSNITAAWGRTGDYLVSTTVAEPRQTGAPTCSRLRMSVGASGTPWFPATQSRLQVGAPGGPSRCVRRRVGWRGAALRGLAFHRAVESARLPAIWRRSPRKSNAAQTRPVAGAARGRSLR